MCLTPVTFKKTKITQYIKDSSPVQSVPCGKCLDCKKSRVNSWFVRLKNELKNATSAHFVTLTYDDETLPHSETWIPTLDYKDYQRTIKRLRKNYKTKIPIKYFAVGEYGTNGQRPHYHAIIFNMENPENLATEWKYGFTHVGEVTDASIYYTLKYCLKNLNTDKEKIDRLPEKALISKKLGIGYLTPQMQKYHRNDVSRSMTLAGNKKIALPRYYRDKIFTDAQKALRAKLMEPIIKEKYEKTLDPLYTQKIAKAYDDENRKLAKTN